MSDTGGVKPLTRSFVLLAVAAATLAAAVTLFVLRSDDTGEGAAQTVYDRMLDGMTREGMVLHTTLAVDECSHREAWIDVELDAVVEEFSFLCGDNDEPNWRTLRRSGNQWRVGTNPVGVVTELKNECRGLRNEALVFFVGCHGLKDVKRSVIRDSEYNGDHALALRAKGTFLEARIEFDEYLYIGEGNGLPIAKIEYWRDLYDGADALPERYLTTYTHEFVDRAKLPDSLFEPASYESRNQDSNPLSEYASR